MKSIQKLVFVLSIVVAGILTYQLYQKSVNQEPEDVKAAYLPAGDFTLEHDGMAFSTSALRGQPFILYFGFTSCPDVCPLGLTVIRDALNSSLRLKQVPALFVSLDPERDTADVLKEYVGFFHENIIPLRGDLVTTQQVAKQYGTYFIKAPLPNSNAGTVDPSGSSDAAANEDQYTVDHTAYFFVIDKEGELKRVLDHNVKPDELAEVLKGLI